MRFLIVDDDYPNRVKIKSLLAQVGDCDCVPSGELALAMFEAAHKERLPYDAITMDLEMPGMNGKEVVAKMRQREVELGVDRPAKVMVITVHSSVDSILHTFEKGCEWYLVKPVTQENLGAALQKLLICDNPWPEETAPGHEETS